MKDMWIQFRNAMEAIVEPEAQAGINFAKAVKNDSEVAAGGNLTTAFTDATTAFVEVPGNLEVKAIAAVTAFLTVLLGAEVAIVKKDAAPVAP